MIEFNGSLDISGVSELLRGRGLEASGKVQQFIDSEVLRKCEPKLPFDTGTLANSGVNNTVLGSGKVQYMTPYARRWYYEAAQFQGAPERGNYWFARMKKNGGADEILRGAKRLAGAR